MASLRISAQEFRFRLSPAEFDQIIAGNVQCFSTKLAGRTFSYSMTLSESVENMALQWRVNGNETALDLLVNCDALHDLHKRMPCRDGLRWADEDGAVVLVEVDLSKKKKRAL